MILLFLKIFRTRLTIWGSSFSTFFFIFMGFKTLQTEPIKIPIFCFSSSLFFGILSVVAIFTYKKYFLALDIKRWKTKGVKSKFDVIGDWIIN